MTQILRKNRLEVVDALRGFAVMAILFVHCMEHFLYFVFPTDQSEWLNQLDQGVHATIFTLFAGKSYAIFALLFGLTFFIQQQNQQKNGKDFGYRFLWRLLLLVVFAEINAMVYPGGDVLLLFVFMALLLFITRKWSTKAVFAVAILFLVQPYEWIQQILGAPVDNHLNGDMYIEIGEIAKHGTIKEFLLANLWLGQQASLYWAFENGRLFQTGGLFLLGMLAGRTALFVETDNNKVFWRNVLIAGAFVYAPLLKLSEMSAGIYAGIAFDMWQKLAFTCVLISSFVQLYWYTDRFRKFCMPLLAYGRMSLTNYLTQTYIGALIFMPIGLHLAPHVGHTVSFLIGIVMLVIQIAFSNWWLRTHRFGPLEWIWHKWTWMGK